MYEIINRITDEEFLFDAFVSFVCLFIIGLCLLGTITTSGQFAYYDNVSGIVTDKRHERNCTDGSCTDSYYISIDETEYFAYEKMYDEIDAGQKVKCEVFGWDLDWVTKNLKNCKYD